MALQGVIGTTTPGGDIDIGVKFVYVYGTITTSGNYAISGVALDFSALTKPVGCPGIPATKGGALPTPTQVTIQGLAAAGNTYQYVPATGKVIGRNAAGTEFPAAAFPADTISFCAVFPRF